MPECAVRLTSSRTRIRGSHVLGHPSRPTQETHHHAADHSMVSTCHAGTDHRHTGLCSVMAESAGQADRALPARRADRYRLAISRRKTRSGAGPAGDRRKPRRCQRHRGHHRCQTVRTGRLHLRLYQLVELLHQHVRVHQAALQPGRFRAGHAAGRGSTGHGGRLEHRHQDTARLHRLRKEEPGQVHLCLVRCRQFIAPVRRDLHPAEQARHRACGLQGRRARHSGRDGRHGHHGHP